MATAKAKSKAPKAKSDAKQLKNFFTIVGIITIILFFLIYLLFQST